MPPSDLFRLDGRVAVLTGGYGTLGSAMARGLLDAGASVVLLGRSAEKAEAAARQLGMDHALGVAADVLDAAALAEARRSVLERFGRVDILVNAAGGNVAEATLAPGADPFGLSPEAMRQVVDLNLHGTILPTQTFGPNLADGDGGVVLNVSSMAASRVISRVVGYSAAKAAVDHYTRWMAVELARRCGDRVRVNAVAPGFFVADQNRALLLEPDGGLTERGQAILDHTPAGRFGEPDDLVGTAVWLCSPAARFVTGVVVPVDGGFSASAGF